MCTGQEMTGAWLSEEGKEWGETVYSVCAQVRLAGTYLGPVSHRGGPGPARRPAAT